MTNTTRHEPERPASELTLEQRVEAIEKALGDLRDKAGNFVAYKRRGGSIDDAVEGVVDAINDALWQYTIRY